MVCDEIALISALQAERLFGVGIDITEIELIQPDNLLLAMPNVLIAPQSVDRSVQTREKTGPDSVAPL